MANNFVRVLEPMEYDLWDKLVDNSNQGSIFCKSFWLRAVGAKFYILGCFDNSSRLIGGIPIVEPKKGFIQMPKLTQTLGIVYDDFSKMKYVKRISKEKEIALAIVENLPKFTFFDYGFHYNFNNWMPFLWNGFNQYSRYTYVIEELSDLEKVRSEFSDTTKSIINKAGKNNLKVINDLTLKDMYNMICLTFMRQNMKPPFSFAWFEEFDKVLYKNNSRKMFFTIDENNNLHAGLYLVYNKNSAYYLLAGADPNFRNSGAMYLNIFEAIKFSSEHSKQFDFEGSIVPNIEHMFRSFGGKQKQYFQISKNNSIMLNFKSDIIKYGKLILKR